MEQKVGVSICLEGDATRVVGSRLCHIRKDMAMIISPALPMVEVERSEDFQEEAVIVDNADLSGETAPYLPKMMPVINASLPVIQLEGYMLQHVLDAIAYIHQRESLQPEEEIIRKINKRIISRLRLQLFLEVMYELASGKRPSDAKPSRGEQVFITFMQGLGQHYAEHWPVARYAEEANLSVRHFSSLVRGYTGQKPVQWIAIYTIGQAKNLLSHTDLAVKEIAEQLGFPEQFTFRKYFKKNTGLSPTEYRKR